MQHDDMTTRDPLTPDAEPTDPFESRDTFETPVAPEPETRYGQRHGESFDPTGTAAENEEHGNEAMGAGAGALAGAGVGAAVGGPVGAVVGGGIGAVAGAVVGESTEGDDEAGSGTGALGGAATGALVGGALAGPPGAVVGGAVGAGAGAGAGDQTAEEVEESDPALIDDSGPASLDR